MYIPKTFKNAIASTFYDKTINILQKDITRDAEGGFVTNTSEILDTFKGNVNFNNFKTIQEEHGIEYQIDISITTMLDVNITNESIISYNDIKYKITDVIVTDTHILLIGTKWE